MLAQMRKMGHNLSHEWRQQGHGLLHHHLHPTTEMQGVAMGDKMVLRKTVTHLLDASSRTLQKLAPALYP
jgi:hypothetical protein